MTAPRESAGAPPASPTPLRKGESIGRYLVDSLVGQGGMAVVYRLTDTRGGPPIALKVLTLATADSEAGRILAREFRVMARLNHPNVVRVLNYDVVHGHPALFMEFLEGEVFSGELRRIQQQDLRARLDVVEDLFYQAGAALRCLHTEKVVHRDLKPSNIIRTPDKTLRLMDFGVAQAEHSGSLMMGEGVVVGTPAYMSPEQITAAPVDHRTDLYALGIIAFELAAGHRPFDAQTFREWQRAHTRRKPPPLRKLVPEVPRALSDIVARLLAKDPDERFPSVQALLDHLDALPLVERTGREAPSAAEVLSVASGPAAVRQLRMPPLVAREREATVLTEAVRRIQSGNGGGYVVVHGQAGIGKTRLVATLLQWAARNRVRTLRTRCSAGGQGRGAFTDLMTDCVRQLVAAGESWAEAASRDLAARLAAVYPGVDRLTGIAPAADPSTLSETERRRLLVEATCQVVERVAAGEPCLLVVEDMHRAGPDAIMAVGGLAAWAREHRLITVATARGGRDAVDRLTGHRMMALTRAPPPLAMLPLSPLTSGDAQRMVAAMLGQARAPSRMADGLDQTGGGNPLVLVETVRDLVQRGALQIAHGADGARWTFKDDAEGDAIAGDPAARVPPAVAMMVAEQVRTLDDDPWRVLQVAASAGHPMPVTVLHQAVGLGGPDGGAMEVGRFGAALAALSEAGWMREQADGVELTSTLCGRAVAEALPARESARYHKAVAQAAEAYFRRRGVDELKEQSDRIALHYEAAGQPSSAARYLMMAAQRDRERHLGRRARESLAKARGLLGQSRGAGTDPLWLELLTQLGTVLLSIGDGEAARDAYEELREAAREIGGEPGAAAEVEALHGMSVALGFLGRPAQAIAPARDAAARLRNSDDVPQRVRVLTALADRFVQRGAFEDAALALQEAQEAAAGPQHAESTAQVGLTAGWLQCAQGAVNVALRLAEQSQRVGGDLPDPSLQSRKLALLAEASLLAGKPYAAGELSRQALRAAARTGNAMREAASHVRLARCLCAMGDLSGADEARRAGAALAQRHGYEELRVRADLVEASVALERRDLAVAEPPLERARARAQELELGALVVEADVLAGWLALERGDRKAQLAIGERLARSAGDRPVSPLAEIEALLLLAESHCRAGHHQAAFDLLQRACPRAGEVGLWEAVVRAWHLLGVTAAALGRADVARDALGRAAQCIAAGHDGWTPVEAERFRSRRRLAAALSAHGPGA